MVYRNFNLAEMLTKQPLTAYKRQPNVGKDMIKGNKTKIKKKTGIIFF